jgi:hypothetical protein
VVRAQDSLTHVEETVYDVLWGPKRKGEQEEHRTVSMGYKVHHHRKGADIYHRKAAVYQVRGYAAALAVQRGEGKTWVLRTGTGVFSSPTGYLPQ